MKIRSQQEEEENYFENIGLNQFQQEQLLNGYVEDKEFYQLLPTVALNSQNEIVLYSDASLIMDDEELESELNPVTKND